MIDAGKLDSQQALKDKEHMFKEKELSARQMQEGAKFGMEVADRNMNRQSAQQQAQKPEKEIRK